jgi:hypothetical protein
MLVTDSLKYMRLNAIARREVSTFKERSLEQHVPHWNMMYMDGKKGRLRCQKS